MQIFFGLFLAITASILAAILNSPSFKGKNGERIVAERLENINCYKYILNNIMINDNGKSRQIDHIAITEYGVFVIETKNYSGTIYGNENSNEWKQYLNKKCFNFKNPIHQNYGHLQIVKQCIGHITEDIYSIVTFIRNCRLKVNVTTSVIFEDQLAKYINSKEKILPKEKIDEIYSILLENRITNKETIRDHNSNVKHYVEYKESLVNEHICPRCHSELVKRNGKNGSFYGCRNYPKCRYTKDIKG